MTPEQVNQALQVLVNAINIAQKRGTYTLQESAAIYTAIQSFAGTSEEVSETSVDAVEEETQSEET
tara:strand:+ start:119 stop:316 length:198 start_codon:yes stop_codon:yes gene_type:complete